MSSIYQFITQMAEIAVAVPGPTHEPGALSRSPILEAGTQVLGPSFSEQLGNQTGSSTGF